MHKVKIEAVEGDISNSDVINAVYLIDNSPPQPKEDGPYLEIKNEPILKPDFLLPKEGRADLKIKQERILTPDLILPHNPPFNSDAMAGIKQETQGLKEEDVETNEPFYGNEQSNSSPNICCPSFSEASANTDPLLPHERNFRIDGGWNPSSGSQLDAAGGVRKNTDVLTHSSSSNSCKKKLHECKVCGKKFDYNSKLIIHQRTHTKERLYECKVCGKKFTQSSNLTKHQKIHTQEKPFECKDCGRKFAYNSTLVEHRGIHTGERPYECTFCGKKFNRNLHYVNHQRIHTGEKPYECKDCGRNFIQSSYFVKHLKLHSRKT